MNPGGSGGAAYSLLPILSTAAPMVASWLILSTAAPMVAGVGVSPPASWRTAVAGRAHYFHRRWWPIGHEYMELLSGSDGAGPVGRNTGRLVGIAWQDAEERGIVTGQVRRGSGFDPTLTQFSGEEGSK
jgi:hypothetical protein